MSNRIHNPVVRRRAIQRELTLRGAVSVDELCRQFGASPATIRRDLAALERDAVLERTHGGAALRMERPAEKAFAVREGEEAEAKHKIADATMRLIEPGATVFMNDGSTNMAVARRIVAAKIEVFVATPAVNIAAALAESDCATVCLLGGFVRKTSLATSGPFAEAMIEQINADLALLSPDGFNLRSGLSFSHVHDAAVARKMAQQAVRTIGLVTAAKFHRLGRIVGIQADHVAAIVTDSRDAELMTDIANYGIEILDSDADHADARQRA